MYLTHILFQCDIVFIEEHWLPVAQLDSLHALITWHQEKLVLAPMIFYVVDPMGGGAEQFFEDVTLKCY